ncbi:hypothetical protein AXF42_Ash014632 [Apostasia shenzhenica]|uniref:K Homology domain-containing protein n=1 Tax=Apostasia shenzhenica TaxID=1088818 RepID=A0A2I0AK80_9ASPA|nr:hypothetical protein AXF42_Ash014632 [Apostasia shenzhenica]
MADVASEAVICGEKGSPAGKEQEVETTEDAAVSVSVEAADLDGVSDHKRKLQDLEPLENDEAPAKKQEISGLETAPESSDNAANEVTEVRETSSHGDADKDLAGEETDGSGHPDKEIVASEVAENSDAALANADGEQPHQYGESYQAGSGEENLETQLLGNGKITSSDDIQHSSAIGTQNTTYLSPDHVNLPPTGQSADLSSSSRKIDIPNNKVGVLIGKSGDTIRFLQINSGAKIQITRDVDADPHSTSRPVELIGTLENINKAERLIRDVIAEADAGGSPSLVARGFSTPQSGGEQIEIQVPNDKVGVIIGKGGETIKNLQTKSGARIQGPSRSSPHSGGYSQQSFRPRGPSPLSQWGPRSATPSQQAMGYDHQQRGMYPPQQTHYPPQPYASYSQQPPPRGPYGSTWDQQRPPAAVPSQPGPPHSGYDYYNQSGPGPITQPSNQVPGSAPPSTHAPMNYNYGQTQAPPYQQPPPTHQSYAHGYNEPKYDNQLQNQQMYGQPQPVGPQSGMYGPQSNAYYGPPRHETPSSYGPPRGSQPGDPMYQAPSSYPPTTPMQQQPYPYGSTAATQQVPPYGQTYGMSSGPADGYSQQPSAGYPQHGSQTGPGYAQGGQQVAPQSGGYGQYPTSQPSYGDQTAQTNVNYGYNQGGAADTGYSGSAPSSGYGTPAAVSGQPGYAQPTNPSGYYDQQMPPQSGYGSAPPASAPGGYVKSVSPQPGYGERFAPRRRRRRRLLTLVELWAIRTPTIVFLVGRRWIR